MAKSEHRSCHSCPRNGQGDDYCWKVCQGPAEKSEKGQNIRRLGQFESPAEFIEANRWDDPNAVTERNDDPAAGLDRDFTFPDDCEPNPEGGTDDGDTDTDTGIDPDSLSDEDRLDQRQPVDRRVTDQLSDDVERALVEIIANLMSLPDTQLCIFRHVFHGEDLKTTGASLPVPISKQAVFKHLLDMTRKNPVVEKVIHGMMKQGHGGAKRTRSQLDLFEAMGLEVE